MVIFWAMPAINALLWIFMNRFPEMITSHLLPYFAELPLPVSARLVGFAVVMIPTGVTMAGIFHLMRLFGRNEHGEIFKLSNVLCYTKLSRMLMW